MPPEKAINIEDLRRAAKRRLPRVIFDFIDGGAEAEHCLRTNEDGFLRHCLVPRYLVDVTSPRQRVEILGQSFASPFGIAPTGLAALARPGADDMLAEAAADADVPFIISGAATSTIANLARIAPKAWYQLYPARTDAVSLDLAKRAADAGLSTLVVTVDVPTHSKRERNARHGWSIGGPGRPPLGVAVEALRHPTWVASYMRHGLPRLENWVPYAGGERDPRKLLAFFASQVPCPHDWRLIERLRNVWNGKLVVKGILHPDDATRAVEAGVDGMIVSNHGGRQLDRAPSSVEMLPLVRDAVGPGVTLMLDSGIRRGSDIAISLCLGASACFVGRATLFGVAAAGRAGAVRALTILRQELDLCLAQIGCPDVAELAPAFLLDEVGRKAARTGSKLEVATLLRDSKARLDTRSSASR